jgi:hypothetical protein
MGALLRGHRSFNDMSHCFLALLLPLVGPGQEPDRTRAWCEDVQFLAHELERILPRDPRPMPRSALTEQPHSVGK